MITENTRIVIFSPNPDDQMRFDNFDDIWAIKTRPHHFHQRRMQREFGDLASP